MPSREFLVCRRFCRSASAVWLCFALTTAACGLDALSGLSGGSGAGSSPGGSGGLDQNQPLSCRDNTVSPTETDIDCGGDTACSRCAAGQKCIVGNDCSSGFCVRGICVAPTCTDGHKNQDETGVDCGGTCAPCDPCLNRSLDASESDVDCGGTCKTRCSVSQSCKANADCSSGICDRGECYPGRRHGYWPVSDWVSALQEPARVPCAQLTHLNVAYVGINSKFECEFLSNQGSGDSADAAAKQRAQALFNYRNTHGLATKLLLSIGGRALSGRFSDAVMAENRPKFVESCTALMNELGADGLDIDWRYPGTKPSDTPNFTAMLAAFREQFAAVKTPDKLLTAVLRPNRINDADNVPYEYASLFAGQPRLLDWATIASYDFHGGTEPQVNFGAALEDVANALTFARDHLGAEHASSLLLGLSFSGPMWSKVPKPPDSGELGIGTPLGVVPFRTAQTYLSIYPTQCQVYSPVSISTRNRFLYCSGKIGEQTDVWISYDDPLVVTRKAKFASINGYGGVAWWLQGQDSEKDELVTAIQQAQDLENPFSDEALLIPGTIQAENYNTGGEGLAYHDDTRTEVHNVYRTDDVDVELSKDVGGGYNVYDTQAMEWLQYAVNVQKSNNYNIEFRTSAVQGGTLSLETNGRALVPQLQVPTTGGAQVFTTVELNNVVLSSGRQALRLMFGSGGTNINWLRFSTGQSSYLGVPHSIPGRIEAEYYDVGGPGLAYFDSSPTKTNVLERVGSVQIERNTTGDGGVHVAGITAGEWLAYTVNIETAGEYTFEISVSSQAKGSLHLDVEGKDLSGPVLLPNVREWDKRIVVESAKKIPLTAGQHVLKLVFDASDTPNEFFIVDWFRLTREQSPFGGQPLTVPGTILAANFDIGGEGVAYHDSTTEEPRNLFEAYRKTDVDVEISKDPGLGFDVAAVTDGEWLEYTLYVDPATPKYDVEVRAASFKGGASLHFEVDGSTVFGPLNIDATGDYQVWKTFKGSGIALPPGIRVLRVVFDKGAANFSSFRFTKSTLP